MRLRSAALVAALLAGPASALEGYVIAAGYQGDSADAQALAVAADLQVTESTWWSISSGHNSVDLPRGTSLDTNYLDIGVDHYFDPIGARFEVAYWGDADLLDSVDARASLYWRNERVTIGVNGEYRDFEFELPTTPVFDEREVRFHAKGIGMDARFALTDTVDFRVSGIRYDYSVPLQIDANRDIVDFLGISRLSLVNSLVDYRVGGGFGIEFGDKRFTADHYTWRGAVDGGHTDSTMLHLLLPVGKRLDLELGIGRDDVELYGKANVYSLFFYFYSAD